MRFHWIAIAAFCSTAVPAIAADSAPQNASPAGEPACVDVQIGNDRSAYLSCLNDALARRVEHERATPQITAPIDAQSSSNQVGTFNDAAAREHMGANFGVSAVPQRPSQVFVSPIAPHAAR